MRGVVAAQRTEHSTVYSIRRKSRSQQNRALTRQEGTPREGSGGRDPNCTEIPEKGQDQIALPVVDAPRRVLYSPLYTIDHCSNQVHEANTATATRVTVSNCPAAYSRTTTDTAFASVAVPWRTIAGSPAALAAAACNTTSRMQGGWTAAAAAAGWGGVEGCVVSQSDTSIIKESKREREREREPP